MRLGKIEAKEEDLAEQSPQGPEKSVFILLLSMLSAKNIICIEQKFVSKNTF